jgi:hypothetical protein
MCTPDYRMLTAVLFSFALGACADSAKDPADFVTPSLTTSSTGTTDLPAARGSFQIVLGQTDSVVAAIGDTVRVLVPVQRRRLSLAVYRRGARSGDGVQLATTSPFAGVIRSTDANVARPLTGTLTGRVTFQGTGRAILILRSLRGIDTIIAVVPAAPAQPQTLPDSSPTPDTPLEPVPPTMDGPVGSAELPRVTVNTTLRARTGRLIPVPANDEAALQTAFNTALPGDEIVLPDGAVYEGNFTLPARRGGAGRVIVRSATIPSDSSRRVTPAAAARFAKIVTQNGIAALRTENGAGGWHFVGLEIAMGSRSTETFGIVLIGNTFERTLSDLPDDVVFDRVYVHGNSTGSTRRCIALNGRAAAVVHSWLSECHSSAFDAQAIVSWAGAGPFLIEDNLLEGSGQNINFGGGSGSIPGGVIPSDITIRRNHFYKPLAWAKTWLVKNLFESKAAQRLLIEENFFENNWVHGQVGFALILTAAADQPTALNADITIRNNIFSNSTGGLYIKSRWPGVAAPARRISVTNNLFEKIGRDPHGYANRGLYLQLIGDMEDVTIANNSWVDGEASTAVMLGGETGRGLTFANNVFGPSEYDVWGEFGQGGKALGTIRYFFPDAKAAGNVFFAGKSAWAGTANIAPASFLPAYFVNAAGNDWQMRAQASVLQPLGTVPGISESLARVRSVRSTY